MPRRETYLKTKRETSLYNLSTSINTMIRDIEKIDKYKKGEIKDKDEKDKYSMYEKYDFKYITLEYNKNNTKCILQMREDVEELSFDTNIIYIKEYAYKKKQDTLTITSKLNDIENFKLQDIELIKELIKTYEDSGRNTFFDNPKTYCISEISNIIGNELNAKKVYTMLLNKLNLIDELIKSFENNTSKYQIAKIKNKDSHLNKELKGYFNKTINEINSGYSLINKSIECRFKDKFEEIKKSYEKQRMNAYNVLFDDAVDEDKDINGFDSPIDIKIEQIRHPIKIEEQKLKLKFSASKFFLIFDLLDEYSDIKLFSAKNEYKRTSMIIKKFYQDKINNIKKYRGQYDKYLHNSKDRAKKVKEIKYFDKLIIENLNVMGQLFCSIENIKKPNLSSLMNSIKDILKEQYLYDSYSLNKKLNKLNKLYSLLIYLIDEHYEKKMLEFLELESEFIEWNYDESEKMKEEELIMCEEFYYTYHTDEELSEKEIKDLDVGSLFGD